jgi:hypothetical protein
VLYMGRNPLALPRYVYFDLFTTQQSTLIGQVDSHATNKYIVIDPNFNAGSKDSVPVREVG